MQNARGSNKTYVLPPRHQCLTWFVSRFRLIELDGHIFCLVDLMARQAVTAKASARAWRCRGERAGEQSHAVPATLPLKPDIHDPTLNLLFRSQVNM